MTHFDQSAATWDQNPVHMEMSKKVSAEMLKLIPIKKQWEVLDYGCGTGSLSFCLQDQFESITMADDSSEMLKVLGEKIKTHQIKNMHPVKLNLMQDQYDKKHDLIYTQMALHHVKDTKKITTLFYAHLKKDGYLAIADLIEEDGSFHSHIPNYDGLNGFQTNYLMEILQAAGFKNIDYKICFEMNRTFKDNTTKKYPIFLMTAKK